MGKFLKEKNDIFIETKFWVYGNIAIFLQYLPKGRQLLWLFSTWVSEPVIGGQLLNKRICSSENKFSFLRVY